MPIDRGRADYFCGREEEKTQFKDFLEDLKNENGATSFLIQGVPGVGKSALIFELSDQLEEKGWRVIRIDPRTLYHIQDFRDKLKRDPFWKVWRKSKIPLNINGKGVEIGTEMQINYHTFIMPLKTVKKPTLIVLDEAQRLRKELKTNLKQK
ncbi:MAG: ATP-binding protein [Flavobacteriaceae bacterium]|nr:ATP-binding protein [Flavobacteriaceae bacterium]MCY4266725.1 ATP-binding protein [Flavobacteriaceae bacterium]